MIPMGPEFEYPLLALIVLLSLFSLILLCVNRPRNKIAIEDRQVIKWNNKGYADQQYHDLSIVIPAFNEHDRIIYTLREIVDYFSLQAAICIELIIVDDASVDETVETVDVFIKTSILGFDVKTLLLPKNRGKGNAIVQVKHNANDRLIVRALKFPMESKCSFLTQMARRRSKSWKS